MAMPNIYSAELQIPWVNGLIDTTKIATAKCKSDVGDFTFSGFPCLDGIPNFIKKTIPLTPIKTYKLSVNVLNDGKIKNFTLPNVECFEYSPTDPKYNNKIKIVACGQLTGRIPKLDELHKIRKITIFDGRKRLVSFNY